MATTYYENIQKLYVAYFNRPADTAGLAYWEGVVEAAKGDTAAVSAAFAADTEYKAAYKDLSNADIVNKVYQNLFGRDAEAAGKAYWADLLDKKTITIDAVVTAVASGAQTTDLTAYNNKVKAATAFTAALDTATEQKGYSGDAANAIAKSFISSVTTDASLAAAIAPATLGATVAKSVAAGTAFSLASGLEALNVATVAKADFLAAADGDNNAKTSTTDAAIGTKVTTAITGVDTLVAGDYTGATAGVRSVLLQSQMSLNAATLADAQAAAATANANIAKVAGLTDAISALDAAKTATKTAQTAQITAEADLAAKVASYNVVNPTKVAAVAANGEITINGTKVVTLDADGKLVLATDVTETTNPGVTTLLNASVATEAAQKTTADAVTAQGNAQTSVDTLDLSAAAQTKLKDVAAAMTIVDLADGATPTSAQIKTELSQLDAINKSAAAVAAQTGATQAQKDAATAAAKAYNDFKGLVDAFVAADTDNPLISKLGTANAAVTSAQDNISNLTKAVTALDTANATAAQLAAVNGQVKAAQDAFTTNKLMLPVTLDATHTSAVATADADIFVVAKGAKDSTITNFGLLGSDSLYIGTQYTLNTGDYTKGAGNNAVLEAFLVKSGSDTKLVLETSAFGSNAATPEIVTITLTGTDSTKVHLTNGIITVA